MDNLKAYDYSKPKYSKINKINETVFNTYWRFKGYKKDFIRKFLMT